MSKKAATRKLQEIDIVVETPRGQRNKFKFEPKSGRFRLGKVLPAGLSFPYDFGFLPETKARCRCVVYRWFRDTLVVPLRRTS